MASSSFGYAMKRVGGLDQCGCGVLPGIQGSHGNDVAAGAVSDHWVSTTNHPTAIAHRGELRR